MNAGLPEELRNLIPQMGTTTVMTFAESLRGERIYFPMKPSKEDRMKVILEKYNGHNHKEIARELDVSIRTVFNYLNYKIRKAE